MLPHLFLTQLKFNVVRVPNCALVRELFVFSIAQLNGRDKVRNVTPSNWSEIIAATVGFLLVLLSSIERFKIKEWVDISVREKLPYRKFMICGGLLIFFFAAHWLYAIYRFEFPDSRLIADGKEYKLVEKEERRWHIARHPLTIKVDRISVTNRIVEVTIAAENQPEGGLQVTSKWGKPGEFTMFGATYRMKIVDLANSISKNDIAFITFERVYPSARGTGLD